MPSPRMAFQSPPQPQAKPSQALHTWPVEQVLQFQPGSCQHPWPTAGRGLQELILCLPLSTDEVKSPQRAQSPVEPAMGGQHLCTPLGVERTLGVLGSNLLRGSPTCHLPLSGAPGVAPDAQQSSIVSCSPGLWFKAHSLPPSRTATARYWPRHKLTPSTSTPGRLTPVALWLNCTSKARNKLSTGPARTHHRDGDQVPVPRNDPGTSRASPGKAALRGESCPRTGGCSERESGLESAGYPQSLPRRKEQKLLEETGEHLSAVGAPGPASPSRHLRGRSADPPTLQIGY